MSEQQVPQAVRPARPPAAGRRGGARYPRTFGGLIAATLVLVVVLVGFWAVNKATHNTPATDNSIPDWQSVVAQIQTVATIAYPGSVPAGWTVTSADWDNTDDPAHPLWKIGLTTPSNQFAGLYQQDAPLNGLIAGTIGSGAVQGTATPSTTLATGLTGAVGASWSSWTAKDGDHGYATTLGKTSLVVYGTNDAVVRQLLGLLTTKKLPASDAE